MAKLIWFEEKDGDEVSRYLGREGESPAWRRTRDAYDATLEQITEFCAQEAEGENYHSLVPVYEKLAKLITKHASAQAALGIMREIAEAGGLQNMG